MDYGSFKQMHGAQLARIPELYWETLHQKLRGEVYDAGEFFTMSPQGGRWRVVVSSRKKIKISDRRHIYLIDHSWTFQLQSVRAQLLSIPGLANRMAALMDVWGVPEIDEGEGEKEEEEEEEDLYDSTDTSEHSGKSESLSSDGDPLAGPAPPPTTLSHTPPKPLPLSHPHPHSHSHTHTRHHRHQAILPSDSSEDEEVTVKPKPFSVKASLPGTESPGFESGGAGYESYAGCESVDDLLDGGREEGEGESQSVSSNEQDVETIPEHLRADSHLPSPPPPAPTITPPPSSGEDQQSMMSSSNKEMESEEVKGEEGKGEEGEGEETVGEQLVDEITERMWKFVGAYTISNAPIPIWYVMDEFGSRIQHSDDASVAMTTFFFIPSQLAFSVMWPLKDLQYGDELTVDCAPQCARPGLERVCHLLPWSHDGHMTLDDPLWDQLKEFTVPELEERCGEDVPLSPQAPPPPQLHFKVFTNIELVKSFLTHPSFEITSSQLDADILWLHQHFKKFNSLKPYQFVNQFPSENVVTCKDLLITVAQRANQTGAPPAACKVPAWFPLSFNLLYELPHFVHCYLERKERGEDNVWILKPWNLGRGMDIQISTNLNQMIRLAQAGPKIASKYISDPVLFHRCDVGPVKFDVRYIVLLLSSSPPILYVYNIFWLRFANKPFSLDSFGDYQKHFTVMNYQDDAELKQIHCNEFIPLFEQQYPQHSWSVVQDKIFSMLREAFSAACRREAPAGIGHFVQSRAIYAADLMLEWSEGGDGRRDIQPKLLEVNFSPDCVRACKYHPQFFNHVFETLFLEESHWRTDLPVTRLL